VGGQTAGMTGVERVVERLSSGLAADRFDQHIAYPRQGQLRERFARHAQVHDLLPVRRFDAAYRDALVAIIQSACIDVVVSHGLRFDFHAALACRKTRTPHVVVRAVALADDPMPGLLRAVYGIADAWTLRSCRGIVAVSEASKKRMVATQHLDAAKVTVIPNGVGMPSVPQDAARSARRALGVEDDAVLVGGVGQLIPRKAFHLLVEALADRRLAGAAPVAVLLGEGPERERLAALAQSRQVRLLMPGYTSDPYPAMAAFDIAVLPSQAEGMPLVVLEAMGLGVACIATQVAGTVEVIEDGRSGLLVPPDDVPSLAAALTKLVQDPGLRQKLAAAGRERVQQRFGLDAMLERFERYLLQIAGRDVA
jgi:glycosyltransferase involved in cell wall biosynthesis